MSVCSSNLKWEKRKVNLYDTSTYDRGGGIYLNAKFFYLNVHYPNAQERGGSNI